MARKRISKADAARPSTADELLTLYYNVPPGEQARFCMALLSDPHSEIHAHYAGLFHAWRAETRAHAEAAEKLRSRTVAPRNSKRDAAIVYLRDVDELTFGQIPRRLIVLNSKWTDRDGKPLSRKAVENAYHRFKSRPTHK
jgi:hypothetical protein